jgi:hypothetical protein
MLTERRPSPFFRVLGILLLSRTLLGLIAWLSTSVIEKAKWYGAPKYFFDLFLRWDTQWYLRIVREGYSYDPHGETTVAFFPLYPLLLKLFSLTGLQVEACGFILSNLFLIVAMYVLYRLTEEETRSPETATAAITLAIFYPGGFFQSLVYTESLFLLLSVSAFYLARKGKWVQASLMGGLLTAARPTGLLIGIPLLAEYLFPDGWRLRRPIFRPGLFSFLLIPSGLAGYMIFLHFKFGDALLFKKAQGAWGRKLSWVWETFATVGQHQMFYRWLFIGAAMLLFLSCLLMLAVRMRPSYVLYSFFTWLFLVSFFYLEGIARFTGVVFPMFMVLAIASDRRPIFRTGLLAAFAMLQMFCVVLAANGYWMT